MSFADSIKHTFRAQGAHMLGKSLIGLAGVFIFIAIWVLIGKNYLTTVLFFILALPIGTAGKALINYSEKQKEKAVRRKK